MSRGRGENIEKTGRLSPRLMLTAQCSIKKPRQKLALPPHTFGPVPASGPTPVPVPVPVPVPGLVPGPAPGPEDEGHLGTQKFKRLGLLRNYSSKFSLPAL